MNYLLELLFTSWVDPLMWFKSMSVMGYQRGKKQSIVAAIVYYWLIFAKNLIGNYTANGTINIVASVSLIIYVFLISVLLFSGDLTERIIYVSLYFSILYVSELIAVRLVLICTHRTFEWLMMNTLANTICAISVKLLQALTFYWIFGRKNCKNLLHLKQEITLAIIVLIIIVNTLISFNYGTSDIGNVPVYDTMVQYFLLSYILAISMILMILKKKEKYITNLSEEISSSSERKELLQELEHFKHDYTAHGSVMLRLLEHKEYDLLKEYMQSVFANVEKTEECYDHPNLVVAILISQLKQKAKNVQISFVAMIQVEDFGMKDDELSSLLHNLVMNGIEATKTVPQEYATVSLEAIYTKDGYTIRCYNPSMGVVSFEKTSKQNKKEHGFGGAIIEKIVKKYHGTVERVSEKTSTAGMYLVVVTIQIPYQHNKFKYE